MSRKSSWWFRPQRKGASNRAALNEANYFMEHNKVLREQIKELAAENAKLRKLVVLGIMLPLNEEQLDCLDKTFVSELGEGLYVQLEKLGIEVTK